MVNLRKKRKSFTLIELVMVIAIVAVVGASVGGIVIYFVQLFTYSPRQLNTQKVAQEVSNIIIEGNPNIRGLRYTRAVIDASAVQYSYGYGYPSRVLSVRFRWDSDDGHIYRSTSTDAGVTWSAESVVPYHISAAITVDGKDTSGTIFTYKKAADADWIAGVDALADIRRVILDLNVKTQSGAFKDFSGSTDSTYSAEIKGF
jgi:prepilin-type N-terminal cleavage/methylation domain-containing protein